MHSHITNGLRFVYFKARDIIRKLPNLINIEGKMWQIRNMWEWLWQNRCRFCGDEEHEIMCHKKMDLKIRGGGERK